MLGNSGFPKLPGFTPNHDPTVPYTQKTDHKRRSDWMQGQNRDYVAVTQANGPFPSYPLPRRAAPEAPDQSRMLDSPWLSTTHAMHPPVNSQEITEQFEPTFVKMDRHVLQFSCFFKEPIVESSLENHRVRKLKLYYYLVDHTLSIVEPKKMNSGAPQGAFLKRQSVLKEDGSGICVLPRDLAVGSTIRIYGKTLQLVDCDQYTREFYEVNGQPQGPPLGTPQDAFDRLPKPGPSGPKDKAMTDYLEKSLGGGRPRDQTQFLSNDRRVLRFYCTSGENYVLHYYLADDTVEILESHYPNDGKVEFPILLRRGKLPKKFVLGQPGSQAQDAFLREFEIEPDTVLSVFGREFQINSADRFTQEYYRQNYSRVFPEGPLPAPAPIEKSNVVIPPYNGIGIEEDTLGYIYRLIPKAPHKDYFKFIDNSHKILRWEAKFNNPQPEDVERRFVIAYYLNDDTAQINEIPQRNSGIQEGKFLTRGRYTNVLNGQYFRPTDFIVGGNVVINSYKFHVEHSDEYTRKYMEATYGTK